MFKDSTIKFSSVDVVIKAFSTITVPIFALILTAEQLGKYGEWFSFYLVIQKLIAIGLPSYLLVRLSKENNENFFINSQKIFIIWHIVVIVFLLLALFLFSSYFLIISLYLAASLFFLIELKSSFYRHKKNVLGYSRLQILYVISFFVAPLIICIFIPSYQSRIIALVTGLLFVNFFIVKQNPSLKNNLHLSDLLLETKRAIRFGFPIIATAFLAWFKFGLDLQFLKQEGGYFYAGNLTLAFQIMTVVSILGALITRNLTPKLYILYKENNSKEFFKNIINYGLFVVIFGILVISLLPLLKVYLPEFSLSSKYGFWMILSAMVMVFAQFFATLFLYLEKTNHIFIFSFISSAIHPLVTYNIISHLDSSYIGISYLISSYIYFLLIYVAFLKFRKRVFT